MWRCDYGRTRNTNLRGRFSNVVLLIRVTCFVKEVKNVYNITSCWSKLAITRRSTVQSLLLWLEPLTININRLLINSNPVEASKRVICCTNKFFWLILKRALLKRYLKVDMYTLLLGEECHTAKGKQTCSYFLSTTEICQFLKWAVKNVTKRSI